MNEPRRIVDDELYCHFVTFSCAGRRRLLDPDPAKRIVVETLSEQRTRADAKCVGFVVMPDHVHAAIWFPQVGRLSRFMQSWKRLSSYRISRWYREHFHRYAGTIEIDAPVWQAKYYSFSIHSEEKLREKLIYMHLNPVRAELVAWAADWRWSSAGWYEDRRSVGVPIEWIG